MFDKLIQKLKKQDKIKKYPSGDSEPSEDDLMITKRLVEAGKILDIKVLDHIIITKNGFFSFKEKGLIRA